MLKIEIDDTGHFHALTVSGPVTLVAALFGAAINAVYNHVSDAHPDAGAAYYVSEKDSTGGVQAKVGKKPKKC